MLTKFMPQPKPPFPYDRPLSHSQLSSFKWNKRQWYDHYVLGIPTVVTPELEFGSMVDKKIQDDPTYLPEIVRLPHLQYELKCEFNGMPLIGFPDALCLKTFNLRDYKTGRKAWDKKRADETAQLSMYLFMIHLIHGINPQKFKCFIDWMPTHYKDGELCFIEPLKIKTFQTKRSMADILRFGNDLLETRKAMIKYYEEQQ